MAVTQDDIVRDEQERSNLQNAVADLETAIAVSNPGTRRLLEHSLVGMKARVATLDKRIEEAKAEHAVEVQTQAVAAARAAALAAKETKLSEEERENYRRFLEKTYFTKQDLGSLDTFYRHSYDRLSESGQDQMSQRIHEGIKRGEFTESDLSAAIRQRDEAHCAAKAAKESSVNFRLESNKPNPVQSTASEKVPVAELDLSSIDLKKVQLADAPDAPSVSSLPKAPNPRAAGR